MLKNILNLEGAQKLTEKEQKTISGGLVAPGDTWIHCYYDMGCRWRGDGWSCIYYNDGWICSHP